MIRSFGDDETQELWETGKSGKSRKRPPPNLQRIALRKLLMLDSARSLDDLGVLPGNRLEKLRDNRRGQYSIRINDQYRICFAWRESDAFEVEIVDYH